MGKKFRIHQKHAKYGRVPKEEAARLAEDSALELSHYKGRGALTNPTGRFESEVDVPLDDGWGTVEALINERQGQIETELIAEKAKTIITTNTSPDISFDRSINPYRGCEHGCIYCYARPAHSYVNLSPGLDFETKIFFKKEAATLLRTAFSKRHYVPEVIALGGNTDIYQPAEKQLLITREILETMLECRHPTGFVTKSALVLRDLDILEEMAKHQLIRIAISVTSLDGKLARIMEPRAAQPKRRLEVIKKLAEKNIPVTAMMAPIIPFINDFEIENVLPAVKRAGASSAGYVLLRLPFELKDLFHEWLSEHFPDRAARVINTLRDMRGGQDYDAEWHIRRTGKGTYANFIRDRFYTALKRHGLKGDPIKLRTNMFRKPPEDTNQRMLDL